MQQAIKIYYKVLHTISKFLTNNQYIFDYLLQPSKLFIVPLCALTAHLQFGSQQLQTCCIRGFVK